MFVQFQLPVNIQQRLADKNQTSNIRGLVHLESSLHLQLKKREGKDEAPQTELCCKSEAGPLAARLCDYFWMPQSCGCAAKLLSATWHNPMAAGSNSQLGASLKHTQRDGRETAASQCDGLNQPVYVPCCSTSKGSFLLVFNCLSLQAHIHWVPLHHRVLIPNLPPPSPAWEEAWLKTAE